MTLASVLCHGRVVGWGLLVLAGCGTAVPAPVVERRAPAKVTAPAPVLSPPAAAARPVPSGFYQVKKGETLASIALDNGQDYKDLVAWNSLDNPNMIRIGQVLRVTPPDGAVVVRPVAEVRPLEVKTAEAAASTPSAAVAASNTETSKREPRGGKQPYSEQAWAAIIRGDDKGIVTASVTAKSDVKVEPPPAPKAELKDAAQEAVDWAWPAAGKMTYAFSEGGSKGIGISGKLGETVMAAAAGKVLYAGEDLRGYGKLVVLKHSANFLSVYAHNSQILVKEGQMVAKGERIAELGKSDSDQPKLHFEIRRQGKPVDPVKFLPVR